MEPHSLRCSFRSGDGTFRIPQALICLLKTCLVGSAEPLVSSTHALSPLQNIKAGLHSLTTLFDPLALNCLSATLVGMVGLTAFCGLGSALWAWNARNRGKDGSVPSVRPAYTAARADPLTDGMFLPGMNYYGCNAVQITCAAFLAAVHMSVLMLSDC